MGCDGPLIVTTDTTTDDVRCQKPRRHSPEPRPTPGPAVAKALTHPDRKPDAHEREGVAVRTRAKLLNPPAVDHVGAGTMRYRIKQAERQEQGSAHPSPHSRTAKPAIIEAPAKRLRQSRLHPPQPKPIAKMSTGISMASVQHSPGDRSRRPEGEPQRPYEPSHEHQG